MDARFQEQLAALLVPALIKHPPAACDAALPGIIMRLAEYVLKLRPQRDAIDCLVDVTAAVISARLKIHQIRMLGVAPGGS